MGTPSALQFLQSRNVKKLAFVCLTHPHVDHFSGLLPILDYYGDNVAEYWMFRLDSKHLSKFVEVQKNAATTATRYRQFKQLCEIFQRLSLRIKNGQIRLLDANQRLLSFGGAEMDCLAPHPRELGRYQSSLARWADHPSEYKANENQLSAVLRIKYGQSRVLLGADATSDSWIDILKESAKRKETLLSNLVKVSHHGSTEGFFRGAWEKISAPRLTHGAISAGSQYGHPHRTVVTALRELQVRLHCTNYAPSCLKTDQLDFSKFEGLSQSTKLHLFMLDEAPETQERPCDGDLHFHLEANGRVTFSHQYSGLCPFHLPF